MARPRSPSLVVRRLVRGASPPRAVARPARRGTFSRSSLQQVVDVTRSRLGPADSSVAPPKRSARRGFSAVEKKFTREVNRSASATLSLEEKRWTLSWEAPVSANPEAEMLLRGVPSPQAKSLEEQLRRLAKNAVGGKRLRQALAKRERARKRQQRHTWKLRASAGLPSILEEISVGPTISVDYLRRLRCFWDFVDLHKLKVEKDTGLDDAVTDWADLEYLSGESFEVGEKLLAALEKWALFAREARLVRLPRFRHALKSWRKNCPKRSRLPMPEEFMWLIAGTLGSAGLISEALFQVALFSTYLRPTALHTLYTDDLVSPQEGAQGPHVLIIAPFEKEKSTKTGYFDETILLDGDMLPELGELMQLQAEAQLERHKDKPAGEAVPLWDFSMRGFIEHWKGAVEMHHLNAMETVYQTRHGGASRDLMLRRRTADEVRGRLHHSTDASFRIYNKPGRVLKLVNELGKAELGYVSSVRKHFAKFVRDGVFLEPPNKLLVAEHF